MFGDQAYWKEADRQLFTAQGVHYRIKRCLSHRPLSERWRLINRARSRTRACGSTGQAAVRFTKLSYRGLAKNLALSADDVCPGQSLRTPPRTASAKGEVRAVRRIQTTGTIVAIRPVQSSLLAPAA